MKTMEQQTKDARFILLAIAATIFTLLALTGCGSGNEDSPSAYAAPIPEPGPRDDGSIVRGVAVYTITSEQQSPFAKLFNQFGLPSAWAASTASTVVTYNNAPAVTFTLNVASFVPGAIVSDTLALGSVTVATLNDNDLKLCAPGGNTKCTKAYLRVYTTGATAGFINTSDSPQYGAPVYTTGLNPSTALTLGSPGINVASLTGIASSKHTVKLSDFPAPTYTVSSDFSNAGAGSYSMTYVVEYALAP